MKLFMQGTVAGFKTKENVNRETGLVTKKLYVGLSSPKENGYEGETVITDIRISDEQMEQGIQSQLLEMRGKEVICQVEANEWSFNKRTGIAWGLSKVNNIQLVQAAKKPGLKEAS